MQLLVTIQNWVVEKAKKLKIMQCSVIIMRQKIMIDDNAPQDQLRGSETKKTGDCC